MKRRDVAVVTAETKLSGKTVTTCADALPAIFATTPGGSTRLQQLGSPHYTDLSIKGTTASISYSSSVGTLVAHGAILVVHESNRWLVDRATALTFARR